MHVQDERVFNFKPQVLVALENSETLALELNMDSINPFSLMQELVMDSSRVLKDLYTTEQYDTIVRFFQDSIHLNLVLFERMMPFFIEQLISTKDLGEEEADALDMYLFKTAKEKGKIIIGLETIDEQIATFKSIPLYIQSKSLLESVRNYGKDTEFDMEKLMQWYTEGNLDSLANISNDYYTDPEAQKLFEEKFIISRNINMIERLIPLLKKGSVFVAVGAAHLPGKDGIIELLRSKGYTVEPL